MIKDLLASIYYSCATAGVIWVVSKFLYSWLRGDQMNKQFINSMADEHLPYIYKSLLKVQLKVGLEVTETPPIKFVHFKDH